MQIIILNSSSSSRYSRILIENIYIFRNLNVLKLKYIKYFLRKVSLSFIVFPVFIQSFIIEFSIWTSVAKAGTPDKYQITKISLSPCPRFESAYC